jgi:hypothetical protein
MTSPDTAVNAVATASALEISGDSSVPPADFFTPTRVMLSA